MIEAHGEGSFHDKNTALAEPRKTTCSKEDDLPQGGQDPELPAELTVRGNAGLLAQRDDLLQGGQSAPDGRRVSRTKHSGGKIVLVSLV